MRSERAYCRGCRRQTRFYLSGEQNGDRPPALFFRCTSCGYERIQLGDPDHGGVPDFVGLCRSVLDQHCRRTGVFDAGHERGFDYSDALDKLIEEGWKIWRSYDPTRGLFLPYATWLLERRTSQYYRDRRGRSGKKALASALSIDAAAYIDRHYTTSGPERSGYETGGDRLGQPLGQRGADHLGDRDPDLSGLLTRGSRQAALAAEKRRLGDEAARRSENGDPEPGDGVPRHRRARRAA